MSNNIIWIVGAGYMGQEFAKVLNGMELPFITVSRNTNRAKNFEEKLNQNVITGGLKKYLSNNPPIPDYVFVATGPESMMENALELIEYGVKNILLEKPAGVNSSEIKTIYDNAKKADAKVFVAYNRRFFQSVLKAKELIELDGGATSFEFDFTEWSHQIEKIEGKLDIELNNWFYANSTHVIDLAFFLGGKPVKMDCNVAGGLVWHKDGSVFAGSGKTNDNTLFCYHSNWESAGRWSVEINTKSHKYILRPLEKLQICDRGSVAIYNYDGIDYSIDTDYKPGIYLEVEAFLNNDASKLKTIEEQFKDSFLYNKILGK